MKQLPTFKGYTVDVKLKEFRKIPMDGMPEFISFDSDEGDKLLSELIESLPIESELFKKIQAIF